MSSIRRWAKYGRATGPNTRWKQYFVASLFVLALVFGVSIVAFTPSTAIPVGVVETGGISMTPTYGTSGIAVYGPGDLDRSDVVIFYEAKNTQEFTMHRVVGETDRGFVTKGDALGMTDQSMGRSYVTPETRVGEVYLVVDSEGVHLPVLG